MLTSVFLTGCSFFRSNENKFAVSVKYKADDSATELKNVSVIIGSDKFWWSDISSGEVKTVNLYTEKNIKANLTFIFEINGEKKTWESENFTENANYQIDLTVDSKGVVSKNIEGK